MGTFGAKFPRTQIEAVAGQTAGLEARRARKHHGNDRAEQTDLAAQNGQKNAQNLQYQLRRYSTLGRYSTLRYSTLGCLKGVE